MSATAVRAVLERSKSKATERVVLVVLAEAVNEAQVKAGQPWDAWPSRARIAALANLADEKQVQKYLRRLEALGEVHATGATKGKGIRIYRLTLPEAAQLDLVDGDDQIPNLGPDSNSSSVGGQIRPPKGGQIEPPGGSDSTPLGGQIRPPEPEGNKEVEPEEKNRTETRRSAPVAAAAIAVPDDLPSLGDEQLTYTDYYDAACILDSLNRLREAKAGQRVEPWVMVNHWGELTQNGRVLVNRLWQNEGLVVDDFIRIAERCFAGNPKWWQGKPLESAAGIFARGCWEFAQSYDPERDDGDDDKREDWF
jgi:hypothetical protein